MRASSWRGLPKALAKKAGALVYVDAVQLVPHRLPDVSSLGCDFLACSSYKFFGPHLGVLWAREELLAGLRTRLSLPAVDPLVHGVDPIVDRLP